MLQKMCQLGDWKEDPVEEMMNQKSKNEESGGIPDSDNDEY